MSREAAGGAVDAPEVLWTVEWAAAKLGLHPTKVRELRAAMESGVDFVKMRGGTVFTEAGLQKLSETVKAALEPVGPAAKLNGTSVHALVHAPWVEPPEIMWKPFTPDPVTVVTLRRILANPVVMEGQLDDGKIVRLRVQRSTQWRPGMRLPCVQLAPDFFEYRGRGPLSRERWR